MLPQRLVQITQDFDELSRWLVSADCLLLSGTVQCNHLEAPGKNILAITGVNSITLANTRVFVWLLIMLHFKAHAEAFYLSI